ncbi:DUF6176 family protein [Sphingomonas bacterium]|uniref:DUF6176 family protein n=1 Tax=Sphingomonas bacterium TaxID=1895847 RepID=UPI001576770E|nr:DUF6176 family protein [Sphingomonas bacterium]
MSRDRRRFGGGMVAGIALMQLLGATRTRTPVEEAATLRPVNVVLHRFDMKPGQQRTFHEWIGFLHARHREAVSTLARERTYFEAMFTAPDEPRRLYWLTVQGTGGAPVESSTLDLDRRHIAYMDAVLAKGTHRRLTTQNVLAADVIVRAVRDAQGAEVP